VSLLGLDAFYLDHRRCGELEAGVYGVVIWFDWSAAQGSPGVLTTATYLTSTAELPTIPAWTAAASC
jgi:hypothetical protein